MRPTIGLDCRLVDPALAQEPRHRLDQARQIGRIDEFADFALSQFGKRAARLEKARGQTLADVLGTPLETEEAAA